MPDFRKALTDARTYVFDGGFGALLQSRGMPAGVSPEAYGLAHPEAVRAAHGDYVRAGAQIITTNTFGGTRFKLDPALDPFEVNRRLAEMARAEAGDNVFVAGSVGPTGRFAEPLGDLTLRDLVEAFREQIRGLAAGGADLILAETHFDLTEVKAVVMAARSVCDLPVGACMTFEGAASLTGASPLTFADTMMNLGADLIGVNCSAGPDEMLDTVQAMLPRLDAPLLVQPNAGLPQLDAEGRTVFPLQAEPYVPKALRFFDLGAKFVGGCCGTTPEHIRRLRAALSDRPWNRPAPSAPASFCLTSRSVSVPVGPGHRPVLIGERINPTGKKLLAEELAAGRTGEALRLAEEQAALGAPVLDVNVGAAMVDEKAVLPALARTLAARFPAPLSLDSTDPEAVEAALWACPGSPLVNSISGEPGRMERLGPLCAAHGAPFILLPIQGKKLPVAAAERLAVIEDLLRRAEDLGVPRRLMLVDVLALTVSSKPEAARECLKVIRRCRESLRLPTTIGLSNISFGLPARELINSTFLSMCLAQGLDAFIANPGSAMIRDALAASEVLLGSDDRAGRFIASHAAWSPAGGTVRAAAAAEIAARTLSEAVVAGARESVLLLLEAELAQGRDPFEIVDRDLIPAIMEVGERYERKEYFLPQLLLSAETLQKAMVRLEPLLEEAGGKASLGTVVMATVEGDIHDIGKNIVCLLLKNHGFEVVDLGKDVPAERIADEAARTRAAVVGLSALMTTTMVRMKDTVDLLRERGVPARVMIGGAVTTQAFADSIGAHGWSADAVSAVKLAKRLSGGAAS